MSALLEMRHVDKSFSGVHALRDVSLELGRGEVLALVGENGAGKSTLMKVLGGAVLPDRGEILINGQAASIMSPADANQAGVAVIYQEFNLIGDLSVRENVFLGRESTRFGFVRRATERQAAARLLATVGCNVDPDARCRDLSISQQQKVEIAKALSANAKIVVMDEPTAALSGQEAEQLFVVISDLKAHGLGVIYVSHRLDEVFAIADRVMVLRDGAVVGSGPIGEWDRRQIIERMVGRPLETEFPKRRVAIGSERLRVEALSRGTEVRDVSFHIRRGEVLGLSGLAGAGRTEIARLVFGADRADSGRILVDGREVKIRGPRQAIANRICLLTEDRKAQGLIMKHSVLNNFGLPNLSDFCRGPFVARRREQSEFEAYAARLNIVVADAHRPAANLSGGNQQKAVLAKWLAGQADIFLFDEPTRGVDVAAKLEIYRLINELAEQGKAILMISSEIPELLGMCDRILVVHGGRVCGEITDVAGATQTDILAYSISA